MDPRVDPRDEDELFWRFHFAEGDILGLKAIEYRALYEPMGEQDPFYTSGLVYVPNRRLPPTYEMDLSCVAAARRARFVDLSLKAVSPTTRSVLWLLYAAPVDWHLFPLYTRPDLAAVSACCNLVEHSKAAAVMHQISRTRKALRPWLVWLAGRASRHKEILEDLRRSVDVMVATAAVEYRRVRRTYGKAVEVGGYAAADGRRGSEALAGRSVSRSGQARS